MQLYFFSTLGKILLVSAITLEIPFQFLPDGKNKRSETLLSFRTGNEDSSFLPHSVLPIQFQFSIFFLSSILLTV